MAIPGLVPHAGLSDGLARPLASSRAPAGDPSASLDAHPPVDSRHIFVDQLTQPPEGTSSFARLSSSSPVGGPPLGPSVPSPPLAGDGAPPASSCSVPPSPARDGTPGGNDPLFWPSAPSSAVVHGRDACPPASLLPLAHFCLAWRFPRQLLGPPPCPPAMPLRRLPVLHQPPPASATVPPSLAFLPRACGPHPPVAAAGVGDGAPPLGSQGRPGRNLASGPSLLLLCCLLMFLASSPWLEVRLVEEALSGRLWVYSPPPHLWLALHSTTSCCSRSCLRLPPSPSTPCPDRLRRACCLLLRRRG